ncbi:TetR/AcrR family transcriptional regulator [Cellulomonas sp. NPDC055163]
MSAHEQDPSSAPDDAAAVEREAQAARREAELLRRDREKAQGAAAKEAERQRRDREKADQAAAKDAERARRDRERAERAAAKEAERSRAERERELQQAERDAARAQREAEKAVQAAALAQQRAAREVAEARRRAARAGLAPAEEAPDRPVRLPRDVEVLWRAAEPPRRGPRPSLTLDRIADAAVALADSEGLGAVSMARLAESLGFTTMSLYRYVSSKDEVLALMADAAVGPPPAPEPGAPDGWRPRLEQLVRAQGPVLRAHPWLAQSDAALHATGPHRLAWMEAMVGALDGTHVHAAEKLGVAALLASHALSEARLASEFTAYERAAAEPQDDDTPRVADYGAIIAALVRPDEHPALAAAVDEGAFAFDGPPDDPDLDFGARLILDGVAALVAERSAGDASP